MLPHYNQIFDLEFTTSANYESAIILKKMFSQTIALQMEEMRSSIRFQMFYWIYEEALCFTFGGFTTPVKFKLTVNSKFEECSKIIINCFDDWQYWTKVDAKWFDKCQLSSGTEVTLYEWKPVVRR